MIIQIASLLFNYWYLIIGAIAIYFILKIIKRGRFTAKTKFRNTYTINFAELIRSVSYYSYPAEDIQYILWSGGYNSTALLCHYFIVLGKPIQPIYITKIGGKQKPEEFANITRIRVELIARYPHLRSRLLPTWYVITIDKNRELTGLLKNIEKTGNFVVITNIMLQTWDAIMRFAVTCPYPVCAGNTLESPLFDIEPDLFSKIMEQTNGNILFPQAEMTSETIKNMALDSKNYYWDLLPQNKAT